MAVEKKSGHKNGPLWAQAIATVLGLGYTPRMPGTVGAAFGLFLYVIAFLMPEKWAFILAGSELIVVLLLSAVAVPGVLAASGKKDPSFVIIDEVAGMLCALTFLAPNFVYLMLSFLFFRVLDIFKPYPINKMENLPGAWGVMADDLAAGVLAGILSILVLRLA